MVGGVSPEVWDPGAVLHLPGGMTLNSANVIKQYLRGAVGAYRERELVIDDLIADGQTLATRWTFRGIPTREMFGVPPSGGRTITITGMDFYRASGGKLVEEWFEAGMFDVLRQLGVLPA